MADCFARASVCAAGLERLLFISGSKPCDARHGARRFGAWCFGRNCDGLVIANGLTFGHIDEAVIGVGTYMPGLVFGR